MFKFLIALLIFLYKISAAEANSEEKSELEQQQSAPSRPILLQKDVRFRQEKCVKLELFVPDEDEPLSRNISTSGTAESSPGSSEDVKLSTDLAEGSPQADESSTQTETKLTTEELLANFTPHPKFWTEMNDWMRDLPECANEMKKCVLIALNACISLRKDLQSRIDQRKESQKITPITLLHESLEKSDEKTYKKLLKGVFTGLKETLEEENRRKFTFETDEVESSLLLDQSSHKFLMTEFLSEQEFVYTVEGSLSIEEQVKKLYLTNDTFDSLKEGDKFLGFKTTPVTLCLDLLNSKGIKTNFKSFEGKEYEFRAILLEVEGETGVIVAKKVFGSVSYLLYLRGAWYRLLIAKWLFENSKHFKLAIYESKIRTEVLKESDEESLSSADDPEDLSEEIDKSTSEEQVTPIPSKTTEFSLEECLVRLSLDSSVLKKTFNWTSHLPECPTEMQKCVFFALHGCSNLRLDIEQRFEQNEGLKSSPDETPSCFLHKFIIKSEKGDFAGILRESFENMIKYTWPHSSTPFPFESEQCRMIFSGDETKPDFDTFLQYTMNEYIYPIYGESDLQTQVNNLLFTDESFRESAQDGRYSSFYSTPETLCLQLVDFKGVLTELKSFEGNNYNLRAVLFEVEGETGVVIVRTLVGRRHSLLYFRNLWYVLKDAENFLKNCTCLKIAIYEQEIPRRGALATVDEKKEPEEQTQGESTGEQMAVEMSVADILVSDKSLVVKSINWSSNLPTCPNQTLQCVLLALNACSNLKEDIEQKFTEYPELKENAYETPELFMSRFLIQSISSNPVDILRETFIKIIQGTYVKCQKPFLFEADEFRVTFFTDAPHSRLEFSTHFFENFFLYKIYGGSSSLEAQVKNLHFQSNPSRQSCPAMSHTGFNKTPETLFLEFLNYSGVPEEICSFEENSYVLRAILLEVGNELAVLTTKKVLGKTFYFLHLRGIWYRLLKPEIFLQEYKSCRVAVYERKN